MAIDIFAPIISQVVEGTKGKVILAYGENRTGKSNQAAKFPKPYFLAFEPGLEAIAGIPFQFISKWSDAESFLTQLQKSANLEKFKENYETIVIDPLDAFGSVAINFVVTTFDKDYIGQKKKGDSKYSPEYKFLETLVQNWIRGLTSLGLTIVFLDHPSYETVEIDGKEYKYAYPSGDNRVVKTVCDLATIIYLKSNGTDENGKVIPSTAYFRENIRGWKAGGRYDHLPYSVEFSYENVEKAFREAVQKDKKAQEIGTISIDTYNQRIVGENEPLDSIKKKIGALRINIKEFDPDLTYYLQVLGNRLGDEGAKIKPLGEEKRVILELILQDLEEYVSQHEDNNTNSEDTNEE